MQILVLLTESEQFGQNSAPIRPTIWQQWLTEYLPTLCNVM